MIGGVSQAPNILGSIYSDLGDQLSNTLARIASGKRTYNPTDDFPAYLKATTINASQLAIQRDKEAIATSRETTQAGIKFGQQVLEQLGKLRDLASQYATAGATAQPDIAAQAGAIKASLTAFVTNTQANGVALNAAVINPTLTKMGSLNVTATNISTSLATAVVTATTGYDVALQEASRYLAVMQSADESLKNLSALSDTASTALSNTRAAIENIDDVQELAKQTDLQIRQQASVAMMAQANASRAGIMRLFA